MGFDTRSRELTITEAVPSPEVCNDAARAAAHVKHGTETEATVLQAKARRLEVEIQLEREMMKEAKAGK
jgi:hypothetical protein